MTFGRVHRTEFFPRLLRGALSSSTSMAYGGMYSIAI